MLARGHRDRSPLPIKIHHLAAPAHPVHHATTPWQLQQPLCIDPTSPDELFCRSALVRLRVPTILPAPKTKCKSFVGLPGPVTHAHAAEQGCPLLRGPLLTKLYAMVSNRTQAFLLQQGGADGTERPVTVNRGATGVLMFIITSGHERAECHPGQPLEVNVAAGPCEHANTPFHSHSIIAYLGAPQVVHHPSSKNKQPVPSDQKGTVRYRRLSLRPKSIWRTKRLPSPCQNPQIPAPLGKTSWLTARPVNATSFPPMPGKPTTRADPHAANARTHVGGGRTPLSGILTRSLTQYSVDHPRHPPGGGPARTCWHSVRPELQPTPQHSKKP